MGAEDDDLSFGDLVDVFDEGDAPASEAIDDVLVVDDLVVDVDIFVWAEVEDLVYDVDGHLYACAEASWVGEEESHGLFVAPSAGWEGAGYDVGL